MIKVISHHNPVTFLIHLRNWGYDTRTAKWGIESSYITPVMCTPAKIASPFSFFTTHGPNN